MPYRVNKGADRPSDVLGIQGTDFLLLLAAAAVALLVVTTLVIVLTRVTPWVAFVFYLVVIVLLYGVLVRLSRHHGEGGLTRHRARAKLPRVIVVRSSAPYQKLRRNDSIPKA